ncbi:MAG: SMP-30/gluconolactonase/LRE family protein [Gammaproteobacteria bacterium]
MNSADARIACVQAANALLGESPAWDSERRVLYWADVERAAIFRWDPDRGQTGFWPMPELLGCIATTRRGRLIFAGAQGIGFFDPETGAIERSAHPEAALPENRFNDGKVDRLGRFWSGTMHVPGTRPSGSLYRLGHELTAQRMDRPFTCPNGIGWSPDNRTMYFTDSMARTIWAYDFNLHSGTLGERRVFARLADHDGLPDGLTVDCEGGVWSAVWDGWRVIRYAPSGAIEREIRMPVQRPTSCAFGGDDLATLFVTSASFELDASALARGPLAGALFSLCPGVAGLPETPFHD